MSRELKSRGPELLMDLGDQASELLVSQFGLDVDQANMAARLLVDRMRDHWGGQLLYFPKGSALDISERDSELWEAFTGSNHEDLARRFGLTVQAVYARIRIIRRALRKHQEPDLFDS